MTRRGPGRRNLRPIATGAVALVVLAGGVVAVRTITQNSTAAFASATPLLPKPTEIGLNLSGLETFNRQQVFTNLISQSVWFSDTGHGWTPMTDAQLDPAGWIRFLKPGEVAPRPLVLPAAPLDQIAVRCTYSGVGMLSAGGIAHVRDQAKGSLDIDLVSEGGDEETAWIQLDSTDPADPLRDLDCRDRSRPASERFHPEFLSFVKGFAAVRFLDWQLTNLNRRIPWPQRTQPGFSSQLGHDGVAVELMVDLANEADVDPWFLMPYNADDAYIAAFARYVHDHLEPGRTVYVELGNEVWNDMFDATMQARREGLAAKLAPPDDPVRAQTRRYAQKSRGALRIWTRVFADDPQRLVRVVSTLNVYPDLARMILDFEDMPQWVDAVATAPYIHLDLAGRGLGDVDWVFAQLDRAIDETIGYAAQHRAIAASYGKRYITYEGGQHLVAQDVELERLLQRDPRMEEVYLRYLGAWQSRIGDRLMLYASTAPIGGSGAWGLREYAGQPPAEAPKLRAVEAFIAHLHQQAG